MADTITFRPTSAQSGFINTMIDAGDYASQSEVIREALRLLQESKAQSKLTELRALIDEAENSPHVENWSADNFMTRMKDKHGE